VSELEELLEAAGEKVNPLELESVFQVRQRFLFAQCLVVFEFQPELPRNSMRMAAASSRWTSS
jgi:hypothetical protein